MTMLLIFIWKDLFGLYLHKNILRRENRNKNLCWFIILQLSITSFHLSIGRWDWAGYPVTLLLWLAYPQEGSIFVPDADLSTFTVWDQSVLRTKKSVKKNLFCDWLTYKVQSKLKKKHIIWNIHYTEDGVHFCTKKGFFDKLRLFDFRRRWYKRLWK